MATHQTFDDEPLPARVIVDSSFVFEVLVDARTNDGRHLACRRFLRQLLQQRTEIVYSELVYVEAPQCWRRLWSRGVLGTAEHSADPAARAAAFREATSRLRQLLATFTGYSATLSPGLAEAAAELAGYYNLRSQDAYLVALSRESGLPDLVTLDRDFRRVDGLIVWSP